MLLRLLFSSLLVAGPAVGQELLVVESTNDTVMRLSAVDGSVIDATFIDMTTSTGTAPSTPIEAIEVGAEIWISDQLADVIFRFDSSGTYLGEYGAGRDNMRGIGMANGNVWVTNSGTGGAGYGDALKEYDTSGVLLNVYDVTAETDPFDVIDYGGQLLVADLLGDDLDLYDYAGSYVGIFHDSDGVTGIDFPEQLVIRASNGNVLAAGFSSPSGIFEYDGTGAEVAFYDTSAQGFTGLRGVHELQNGNLLFTNGSGVHVWDIGTGIVSTIVPGVSGRYITEVAGGPDCPVVYCDSNPDNVADLTVDTCSCGGGSVMLMLSGATPNDFGYPLVSAGNGVVTDPPGALGDLCLLGSSIGRYSLDVVTNDGSGNASLDLLNAATGGGGGNIPLPIGGNLCAPPGQTWNFQWWYRDGANPARFSKAVQVLFQ